MGIYDRNYTQDHYRSPGFIRFTPGRMPPVVKWLLIINVSVFIISLLVKPLGDALFEWFSVYPRDLQTTLQLWRIITYQFLHGNIFHILFNMLILFFFGPVLERLWGSKRFLVFYLVCGSVGGIVYPVLVGMGFMAPLPMVGASGSLYGMLAAGAILFPRQIVYIFGVFPLPFAVMAIILVVINLLSLIGGPNAGGNAAHLAGMAAGAAYVLWKPITQKYATKSGQGRWERKMQAKQNFQAEVDRILDKVNHSGLRSLTRKEKEILREATRREQSGQL